MISDVSTDLAAGRFERIRQILQQKRIVSVEDLCAALGVSAATIRRDLLKLDRDGEVRRVHGGAVLVESSLDEPVFEDKAELATGEKQRIARAALAFIKPTDSVFLDGGSTVLALARLLTTMSRATVVTNSLRVVGAFAAGGPRVITTGGELRRISQTFVGPLTRPLLETLHVDTAFMGTIGLSAEKGMTTTDPQEAQTKEFVLSRARQVVLLADSSKIGKMSFVSFGGLDRIDVLITDGGVDPKALRRFRKAGLRTMVV